MKVASGWPRRLSEAFVRVLLAEQFVMHHGGATGSALRRWLNRQLEPILTEEGMYTETLFLDREDGDLYVLWYMEAEDVAGVYEEFLASNHPLTDVADRAAGRLFEDAEKVLTTDVESDCPLLAHAWNPNRP